MGPHCAYHIPRRQCEVRGYGSGGRRAKTLVPRTWGCAQLAVENVSWLGVTAPRARSVRLTVACTSARGACAPAARSLINVS